MENAFRGTLSYTIKIFEKEDKRIDEDRIGHIVDFQEDSDYKLHISITIEYLNKVKDELFTSMINLAASGKWKKWSDEQAEETSFIFTQAMLSNTGDKKVDSLMSLYERISSTIAQLE